MDAGLRSTISYSARCSTIGRQSTIAEADRIGGRILDVGVGTGLSLVDYSRTTNFAASIFPNRCCARRRSVSARSTLSTSRRWRSWTPRTWHSRIMFDAVVAQYVITAVPDPEATLDDFIRVLKPGGRAHFGQSYRCRGRRAAGFRVGVCTACEAARVAARIPWSRLVDWAAKHGGVRLAERPPDAADGTFLADPLPQI